MCRSIDVSSASATLIGCYMEAVGGAWIAELLASIVADSEKGTRPASWKVTLPCSATEEANRLRCRIDEGVGLRTVEHVARRRDFDCFGCQFER